MAVSILEVLCRTNQDASSSAAASAPSREGVAERGFWSAPAAASASGAKGDTAVAPAQKENEEQLKSSGGEATILQDRRTPRNANQQRKEPGRMLKWTGILGYVGKAFELGRRRPEHQDRHGKEGHRK